MGILVDIDREHRAENLLYHRLVLWIARDHHSGFNEVALAVVISAADDDLRIGRGLRMVDIGEDLCRRPFDRSPH